MQNIHSAHILLHSNESDSFPEFQLVFLSAFRNCTTSLQVSSAPQRLWELLFQVSVKCSKIVKLRPHKWTFAKENVSKTDTSVAVRKP